MNYAEVLASWYLRLNGFFVLDGFVVHDLENPGAASDWDVLAVRHPHTFEVVGGLPEDWDPALVDLLSWDRTIGMLVEVKSGGLGRTDPFRRTKTTYGLGRLGFVPQWDHVADVLEEAPTAPVEDSHEVAKLLIAPEDTDRFSPHLFLALDHVAGFISDRFTKYQEIKFADRMRFPSGEMQLLIDQARGQAAEDVGH